MKQKIKKLLSVFLTAVMLLSLAAPVLATEQEQTPDLRVGILSDVHLGYAGDKEVQTVRFKKALEAFKEMGVDAVIVAGDLQDSYGTSEASLEEQKYYMEEFASTWFEVFPADSGVEPVLIYGNHDDSLIAAQYWPESFGSYADAFLKEVNGYQFVGVHNGKEGVAAVDAYLSQAAAASADKPVFYIQHYPIYQTVPGSSGNYTYSKNGYENLSMYFNVVAFNGHTHCTLTDERSIWQGEDWQQAQFTVVNTATINYGGLGESGLGSAATSVAVNETNGWKGLTQHGMYMTVTGSQVSIDRYSFDGETPLKLGESWSFDACDTEDRPYTQANRYEIAAAPVFEEGAALTVSNITDTSASVLIPAASLPAVEGYSDMIHSYVVEATDPATGKVMARGAVATEHHIDTEDRFSSEYTVNISGLQPGKTYILNAYAQEFFQKRSEPLSVSITTTGTAASGEQGDVNGDGVVNEDDLTLLQAICDGTAEDTQWSDVDGNRVKEKADLTALENILANKKAVSEDPAVDLLGSASDAQFVNASGSAWSYGLQTAVTNGGTGVALKAACTEAAGWPYGKVYFDEPQDWSAFSQLYFDSLFTNDSSSNWLAVSLISGHEYQLSSAAFPSHGNEWTTNNVNLSQFTNVDFSDIRGIQFSYNMNGYEGRYDGVTEHGVYIDNVHTALIQLDAPDGDLLGTAAQIAGGQRVQGVGQIAGNGSMEAVKATDNAVTVTFAEAQALNAVKGFVLDAKVSGSLSVQAVAADGSLLGNAAAVSGKSKWQNVTVSLEALGLTDADTVAGLCFTSDNSGYLLDNLYAEYRKDGDLSDTATWANSSPESYSISIQGKVTNNSFVAAEIKVTNDQPYNWPKFEAYLPSDFDGQSKYLTFDVKRAAAGGDLYVVALDANGNKLGNDLVATTPAAGWTTYSIDLTEKGLTEEQISQIAAIRFAPNINTATAQVGDAMYVDNIEFLQDDDLISGAKLSCNATPNYSVELQREVTNGSQEAVAMKVMSTNPGRWPQMSIKLSGATGERSKYLTFDVKKANAANTLWVVALDSNGNKLGEDLVAETPAANGWTHYCIDLTEKGLTEEQIGQIAAIRFAPDMVNTASAQVGDAMYVDNLRFVREQNDLSVTAKWKNTSPDSYAISVQSKVTNGSSEAVAIRVIKEGPWNAPKFDAYIAGEATRYLTFDVKRAAVAGMLWVVALDANGNEINSSFVATTPSADSWTTYSVDLIAKGFTEEQIGQIAGIRFAPSVNASTAQVGDAMYVDNLQFLRDEDLIIGSTWTGANLNDYSVVLQSDVTNGSHEAIAMKVTNANGTNAPYEWPQLVAQLPGDFDGQTRYLTFDVKRAAAGGVLYVAVYDASGNKLGNDLVASTPAEGWTSYSIDLIAKGLTEDQIRQIASIKFAPRIYTANAVAGDAMYVDNLKFLRDDLVDRSTWTGINAEDYSISLQSAVTNNSEEAVEIKIVNANGNTDPHCWPQFVANFPGTFGQQTRYLTFDVKRAAAGGDLYVAVYDASGNKLGKDLVATTPAEGWTSYSIDLLEKGLTEEQIGQIASIKFAPYISTTAAVAGDAMYVDNIEFLQDDDLISGAKLSCNATPNYSVELQREVTNGSQEAVAMKVMKTDPGRWPQMSIKLSSVTGERSKYLTFDVKKANAGSTLWVSVLDASGNKLGNDLVAETPSANGWTHYCIDLTEKGLTEEQIGQIATIRFAPDMVNTASAQVGDAMYVDNLRFVQEQDDLSVTAKWKNTSPDSYAISVQSKVTNGSSEAVAICVIKEGPWNAPKFDAYIAGEATRYLTFDVKRAVAAGMLWVVALDANGNEINSSFVATTPSADSWTTYSVDLIAKGFTEEQIGQIAGIRFAPSVNTSTAQVGDAMYVDNIQFLPEDNG